jgi:lipopolysaccharide biosynthesis glycosyltransferase
MNIYSCVDSKNIDKLIVLFYSCFINCSKKDNLNFFILTDSNDYDIPRIPLDIIDNVTIKTVEFNDRWMTLLNDFNNNFYQDCSWCKSNMNFSRFLFFKVFPDIDRAIYLDWDMIVTADIYDIEYAYNSTNDMVISRINERSIYQNIFNASFKGNLYSKNTLKIKSVLEQLNTNSKKICTLSHFCAGFFIVSSIHFEELYLIDFIQNLINIQEKYRCFNFGTQAVMNLMHLDNRLYVSKLWNYTPDPHIIDTIKIIHWNGKDKPWTDKDNKRNSIWWKYYDLIH